MKNKPLPKIGKPVKAYGQITEDFITAGMRKIFLSSGEEWSLEKSKALWEIVSVRTHRNPVADNHAIVFADMTANNPARMAKILPKVIKLFEKITKEPLACYVGYVHHLEMDKHPEAKKRLEMLNTETATYIADYLSKVIPGINAKTVDNARAMLRKLTD